MTKIRVFTKEDELCGYNGTELTHLRPRAYMTSYSFEALMDYAKEELYWADIPEDAVIGFEIYNKKEHWCDYISRKVSE